MKLYAKEKKRVEFRFLSYSFSSFRCEGYESRWMLTPIPITTSTILIHKAKAVKKEVKTSDAHITANETALARTGIYRSSR